MSDDPSFCFQPDAEVDLIDSCGYKADWSLMFGFFKKTAPPPPPDEKTDPLCLVFVPALVVLLLRAEKLKGEPLTEAEVIRIRDDAACIALPTSQASMLASNRGYEDIVAGHAWSEWQRVRLELGPA